MLEHSAKILLDPAFRVIGLLYRSSSVDCGARDPRYFRFRSGSHFGSKKGFFGLFLGVFGSQTSRTSRGTKKRPIRGRVWRRLGFYIYTIERTKGCHFWSKKGVLGCFLGFFGSQTSRTSRETKRSANQRLSLAQAWPLYIHTQ